MVLIQICVIVVSFTEHLYLGGVYIVYPIISIYTFLVFSSAM